MYNCLGDDTGLLHILILTGVLVGCLRSIPNPLVPAVMLSLWSGRLSSLHRTGTVMLGLASLCSRWWTATVNSCVPCTYSLRSRHCASPVNCNSTVLGEIIFGTFPGGHSMFVVSENCSALPRWRG